MRTLRRVGGVLVPAAILLAVGAGSAWAVTQTRDDPSDSPAGAFGKADLRRIDWATGGPTATLTVAIEDSSFGAGERATIGVHVLIDHDLNGIADQEIAATRDVDGSSVDVVLRNLTRSLSTSDCQDLAGAPTAAQATVVTTVAGGLETFAFSFDAALVPGSLATFRWAAFGQAPDGAAVAPWDVMPDAANPEPAAANPGDRRCDSADSGLSVRMSAGVPFPDPISAPAPPAAGPTGVRAAALKKCKKRNSAKARARCRRKAKELPL